MTDTQHTPGPWAICPHGRLTPGATVPIHSAPDAEGFRFTVALVRTIGPEGDADARLITAAPELLDALQSILDIEPSGLSNEERQLYALARAAIAKATGQ